MFFKKRPIFLGVVVLVLFVFYTEMSDSKRITEQSLGTSAPLKDDSAKVQAPKTLSPSGTSVPFKDDSANVQVSNTFPKAGQQISGEECKRQFVSKNRRICLSPNAPAFYERETEGQIDGLVTLESEIPTPVHDFAAISTNTQAKVEPGTIFIPFYVKDCGWFCK